MEEIHDIKEGVRRIFAEHALDAPEFEVIGGRRYDTLVSGGKRTALVPFRECIRTRATGEIGAIGTPLAVTSYFVSSDSLDALLFRELDTAEYLLKAEVERVTLYANGDSAVALVGLTGGRTATITICSSPYGERQFKHEVFGTEGGASDRAVDTMVAQCALNVYTKDGYERFTDDHVKLYGLSAEDREKVYCIFNTFTREDRDKIDVGVKRLDRIVDAALAGKKRTVVKGEDF